MSNEVTLATAQSRILSLPERPPFMLDADLATFYGTSTKAVNQAVKRNPDRFPEDFCFQLTEAETGVLRSQNVTANADCGAKMEPQISTMSRALPLAFTQAGALALSGVLKTPRAAEVSVMVFRAFAALDEMARAAARVPPTATIPMDEYLDLLKSKLALLVGPTRRKMTPEEDAEILRLWRQGGLAKGEIGRRVGRSGGAVWSALRRMGEI